MRDAFGGIVNITMIVVFLVIVSGYLAFNVSYTKAFRVKNKIITTIEQYEGNCGNGSKCVEIIENYTKSIGYNSPAIEPDRICGGNSNDLPDGSKGYFIERCKADNDTDPNAVVDNQKSYYRVVTAIDINIPIINKVMSGLRIFQLSGNTKLIRDRNA